MDLAVLLKIVAVALVVVFALWWREYRRLSNQRNLSGDISHLARADARPENTAAREAWKNTSQQVGTVRTKMRAGLNLLRSVVIIVAGGVLTPLFAFGALAGSDSSWKNRAVMGGLAVAMAAAVWYFFRVAKESWGALKDKSLDASS